jgi:hypothetical protein
MVFSKVAGHRVEEARFDGNHVVATSEGRPWRKQANLILGYGAFYNPLSLLGAMIRPKQRLAGADIGMQIIGMTALAKTTLDSIIWGWRLWRGPVERCQEVPGAKLPMVKARPDEIETKRPTAIPPDSAEVYGMRVGDEASKNGFALPILAAG